MLIIFVNIILIDFCDLNIIRRLFLCNYCFFKINSFSLNLIFFILSGLFFFGFTLFFKNFLLLRIHHTIRHFYFFMIRVFLVFFRNNFSTFKDLVFLLILINLFILKAENVEIVILKIL